MQFQIISKDPAETAKFYSELFGWMVNADNAMGYRRIYTGSPEGHSRRHLARAAAGPELRATLHRGGRYLAPRCRRRKGWERSC